MVQLFKKFTGLMLIVGVVAFSTSCGREVDFTRSALSQAFIQDFNPQVLDVLWMVDNRSTLSSNSASQAKLVSEARNFFVRLDGMANTQYRMGFINADAEKSLPGLLQPRPIC